MDFAVKIIKIDGHKTGLFSIILVEQVSLGTVLLCPASVTYSKATGSRTCFLCLCLHIPIQEVLTVSCSINFQNNTVVKDRTSYQVSLLLCWFWLG